MPTDGQYLRGTDDKLPERIELQAGPLSMCFEPEIGFLRYIRLGDQEILRGLYSAVRDHNWDTIAPEITNLRITRGEGSFEVTFDVSHVERDIDFKWHGSITGQSSGTVSFGMDGEAHSTFRRNRVGFCVLHSPAHVAGKLCLLEKDDGSSEEGRFPDAISPHQPFVDLRAISHTVIPGVQAEVRFEGDVFEMEDQRNWTDASYKTYCTPLVIPYPVEVELGTKISQKVTISLKGEVDPVGGEESGDTVLSVKPADVRSIPTIGLCIAADNQELTDSQINALESMHLDHLRCDVSLAEAAWEAGLKQAARQASAIGARLEIALYVSDAASAELKTFVDVLGEYDVEVSRFLLFHVAELATDRKWIAVAREALKQFDAPLVSGANAYFTELNRNRPALDALDGVCYSLNPQVHAFDDASLMETPIAQGWTVESARSFAKKLPIHVGPITLSPRFNPNATGLDLEQAFGRLPSDVDTRQMSLLGAAWTVGSLKYLTESRAASLTYFETVGWKGIMDTEAGSSAPFPAVPDGVFPMAHVFTWFGGMSAGELLVTESSNHRCVDGLTLRQNNWVRFLIANQTAEPQKVRINCPGLTGSVRVEMLDSETVERATTEPRGFRSRKDIQNTETNGGTFGVALQPYAVVCVKGQIVD
ncbi:MAG: hypothetical protein VX910_11340 [Candidatus Latescibacterota bacterium]|nr:hypothetical protein [Candidatus Latescibacterota bacterium]